jgi:PPE-repeat protein
VLDFGALPPEINSGRMYAGPGSGPLMASVSVWHAVASQLESVGRGYSSVIASLQGDGWSGSASTAMADAAGPYVEWAATAAAAAEESAGQARAAAAAYETAYVAMAPPALVAANRAQYQALVMTNMFGHNTAQIAATETAYAEMWAQDAQAMYGYAASSSAATELTPFSEPPQTTIASAESGQSAAVAQAVGGSTASNSQSALSQLVTAIPQQLQNLSTGGSSASTSAASTSVLDAFSAFNTLASPSNLAAGYARTFFGGGSFLTGAYRSALQAKDLPKIAEEDAGAAARKASVLVPEGGRAPVLASVGRAAPIGGLSVPQAWASATPVASAVEEPQWLSEADLGAVPASAETAGVGAPGAGPMMGMGPTSGQWARPSVNNVLRVPSRGFKMPRPSLGG